MVTATQRKDSTILADYAEELLLAGFSVVPVTKAKTPPKDYKWETFQSKPLDPDRAKEVFQNAWGIGLICGMVSEGTECIDFDPHGHDIKTIIGQWHSDPGVNTIMERHDFYIEQSPSGGYHVLFKYEANQHEGNQVMARWPDGQTMIETRAECGYVVVAPSPGYGHKRGDLLNLPVLTREERDYLIETARKFNQFVKPVDEANDPANFHSTDPVSWFNWHGAADAKALLKAAGWSVKSEGKGHDRVEYWQRPGKDRNESHSATWGHRFNALYVFSTSAAPLKGGCYYTPFQILTIFQFKGNFSEAIQWISSQMSHEMNDSKWLPPVTPSTGLLVAKPVSEWLRETVGKSMPRMLFDEFWFEQEICLCFAETGAGKTILAVQVADAISKGESITGFSMESQPQGVIYFDFELNAMQWATRYSYQKSGSRYYAFSDNFIRVEINPDGEIPQGQTFENYLNAAIEQQVSSTGAKILIIDNITYLSADNTAGKDALPLMKSLKRLRAKYNLSILLLGHIPKIDNTQPLTRNSSAGSKQLMNFVDSSFAIGESATGESLRYLKQIKPSRSTGAIKYHSGSVIVCQIIHPDNFTKFDFSHYSTEKEHLPVDKKRLSKTEVIKFLFYDCKNTNQSDIARAMNCDQSYVSKVLTRARENSI